jgi:hypothetical protein
LPKFWVGSAWFGRSASEESAFNFAQTDPRLIAQRPF